MNVNMFNIKKKINPKEDSTGIRENKSGIGKVYDTNGHSLDDNQIKITHEIEVPNTGSGSYNRVFKKMGYSHIVNWSHFSSAGDWEFFVSKDSKNWFLAWQRNRYPHYGFKYTVMTRPAIKSKKVLDKGDIVELSRKTKKEIEDMEHIIFYIGCD